MRKIQNGDKVKVMRGADKGTVSTVIEIVDENYIIVKDVKIAKKAVKQKGFVEKAMPIHISNVMIYNEKESKATRVGINMDGDKKVRVSKKTGEKILKSK